MLLRLALAAGVALAIAPGAAHAAGGPASVAPPGSAAVDQYRETAPPAGAHGKKLSAKQQRKLRAQGKDGAALAAVIDRNGGIPGGGTSAGGDGSAANGPSSSRDAGSSRDASGRGDRTGKAEDADRPVDQAKLGADRSAATSTVGPFPVWTLLLAAAVLVGLGLLVRRRPPA